MTIVQVSTHKQKKQYIDFMRSVYVGNIYYKDVNIFFARNFLFKADLFSRKCDILPILVANNNNILACAMLISYPSANQLFLSFFEALPNQAEAVEQIISLARDRAKAKNKSKIIIGINGHISYSVGILANNYNQVQTFDSNYNPAYYTDYFDKYYFVKKDAVSYIYDLNKIKFDEQILKDVYRNVSFRKLNKKNFKKDILIFGDLCDRALCGTPLYYKKTKEEMYDSLKTMKYIFKADNLIFAIKNGVEIGFILMHPDYNQLVSNQKITPIKIFVGVNLIRKKIDTLIINIIGVLPEHQNNKVIIGLLNEASKIVSNKYKKIISTFVMKDNQKSTKLCSSMASGQLNQYFIYEIEI